MNVLRYCVLGVLVAAFWMGLAAPAGASVKYEEEYVYPPAARQGKPYRAPRAATALSGRILLNGRNLSRIAADTPWRIRLGQTLLPGGTLADASRFRAGKARGLASIRLRDGGRLRMEWDRRYLRFSLNLKTGPQFITPPKPPLKPRRAASVPSQVVGFALGDLAVLHDLPLKSRTTRRGVFLRGLQRNHGSPWQAVTILSPAHGSSTRALPVYVKLYFDATADPSKKTVQMNGIDITAHVNPAAQPTQGNSSSAAMPTDGVHEGRILRPAVSLGKNQVRVTAGPLTASATFFYGTASSLANGLPLLVPIQTRYLLPTGNGTHATDYGIALYLDPENPTTPKVYYAPDGSTTGFQILYLSRADLSVVSNQTVPNPQPNPTGTFNQSGNQSSLYGQLVAPPAGCGIVGCILIVQSLESIGYTPAYQSLNCPDWQSPNVCYENLYSDQANFFGLFQGLGGSSRIYYANGANSQIAYSFIGNTKSQGPLNAPVPAGTFFERLTCSGSNYGTNQGLPVCDSLGYPNTSYTAPANPPSGTNPLSVIGKMDGALIVDNQGNYTYAPNARPVHFSTSTDTTNLIHTITVDGVPYVSDALNGSPGGFHFLLLDRDTLAVREHKTYPAQPDASEVSALHDLANTYGSYNNLFIISAYGNNSYQCNAGSWCGGRYNWAERGTGLMEALGGTWQVFYQANNPEANPQVSDDYTLVGAWVDPPPPSRPIPTGLEGQTYAEMSSVIARTTEKYPLDSDMEGILTQDHQGYYSPGPTSHSLQFSSVATAEFLAASLLPPTAWPTAPPHWSTPDPAKAMAAYTWISKELCCEDIRAAYSNLNSAPAVWLAQLQALAYDPNAALDFSAGDFAAMKAELLQEFQYVQVVRQFQNNLFGTLLSQQGNLSLLITQVVNEVTGSLDHDLATQSAASPGWLSILGDVFGAAASVVEFGALVSGEPEVGTAISVANGSLGLISLGLETAASTTNSPDGTPLRARENVEIAVSEIAGDLADGYARSLASLGNQFDRIVADGGRLAKLGGALVANEIPWNANTAGYFLATFDRVVRRELYTKLIKANTELTIYPYITDYLQGLVNTPSVYESGGLQHCHWDEVFKGYAGNFMLNTGGLLFYPTGVHTTDPGQQGIYPTEFQWGVRALTLKTNPGNACATNAVKTDQYGLFRPMDPNDPNSLGAYPFWWFTREGYDTTTNTQNTPCYISSIGCPN